VGGLPKCSTGSFPVKLSSSHLLFTFAFALHPQEAKDPAFEVASIKPLGPPILKPGEILGLRYAGNRVSGRTQLFAMI
jgi:hypothetical protein